MDESFTQTLHEWAAFYMLVGPAAATLTGLIFVAVSLGAHLVNNETISDVQAFVTPTIIYFVEVLIISSLMNAPVPSGLILGGCLVPLGLIGLGRSINVTWWLWRRNKLKPFSSYWTWHVLLPLVSYLLISGAAMGFLQGFLPTQGFIALALATMLLLLLGIHNTWDLTLWIVQQKPS
jgi:hypothetical protein